MSRLNALKQKIDKLPQQNAALKNINRLKQESSNVEKIRTDFEEAANYLETLLEYEALSVTTEQQKLNNVSKNAKAIKGQFEDYENFSKQIYQNWLVKNKEVPTQVISSLKMKWSTHVQNQLNKYKSIMDLANNARLPGATEMSKELAAITIEFQNIPAGYTKIESFEKRVAEFPTYISSLGLSMKIEDFLRKASSAGADPNLLYDDEIKEFLQENPGLLGQMRLKITV
jgi:hypothetical protein